VFNKDKFLWGDNKTHILIDWEGPYKKWGKVQDAYRKAVHLYVGWRGWKALTSWRISYVSYEFEISIHSKFWIDFRIQIGGNE
jgi:hypothetical protein